MATEEKIEKTVCPMCKVEKNLSNGYADDEDTPICEECYNDNFFTCEDCDGTIHNDDKVIVYNTFGGDSHYVCGDCSSDNYTYCENCNDYYASDYVSSDLNDNYYCAHCRGESIGDWEEEERTDEPRRNQNRPRLNTAVTTFQGESKGSIITDKRLFSAEIECYYPSTDGYYKVIEEVNEKFIGTGQVSDGSLDSNGIEFQTPILQGKKGQSYIEDLTKLLVKNGFYVNIKAGTHIHLDGKGFTIQSLYTDEEILNRKLNFFFNCGKTSMEYKTLVNNMRCLTRTGDIDRSVIYPDGVLKTVSDLNNAQYLGMSTSEIEGKKLIDKKYLLHMSKMEPVEVLQHIKSVLSSFNYILTDSDIARFDKYMSDWYSQRLLTKLKQLFTVYYFADDFIMQLLPHSRRNNKYCLPLWKEFNIKTIDNLSTVSEFEKMWYQMDDLHYIKSKKGNPKDESRRHGANFHILMCQGHFEIRYHSGTINADKILYWVQLNQALMNLADTVIGGDNDFWRVREELEQIKFIQNLKLRRQRMYKLLKLPKDAIEYWEARAEKFTDDNELAPVVKQVGNSQDL